MPQHIIHRLISLFAIGCVSASIALAQASPASEPRTSIARNTWPYAQLIGSPKGKLFVVSVDQPNRRQTCRVQSFTLDELVCLHAIGGTRTYLPQQVVALILPGDGNLKLRLVLGLNGGLGAAIYGTVVLAAICPPCAVATGIVALVLFGAAGAILIGYDQPDHVLYLAPGQRLTGKGFAHLDGLSD